MHDKSGLSGSEDFHDAERKLCKRRFWECPMYGAIIATAGAFTKAFFGTQGGKGGRPNAFRHILYAALTVAYLGRTDALRWQAAHEAGASASDADHRTDLLNNTIGNTLGSTIGWKTKLMGYHRVASYLAYRVWDYIKRGVYWHVCGKGKKAKPC